MVFMKQMFFCLGLFFLITANSQVTRTKVDNATKYYNLGWDYYKQDSIGTARYYWELSSKTLGNSRSKLAAMYRLGLMQQEGEGVEVNLKMAYEFFLKASGYPNFLGDPDANKNIGTYYENGMHLKQNNAKALQWYLRAKKAGNKFVDDDIKRMRERIATEQ
jgi:TPR repeat protein